MYRTTITLAGITVSVEHYFESFISFARDYTVNSDKTDFAVKITAEDIEKEWIYLKRQCEAEGRQSEQITDAMLEETAVFRKIANNMINYNILVFHGAVIAKENEAYLFTAKSGTGKTTHCRLWLKNIPDCYILNGDKPLLLFNDGKVFACGNPWMGKEKYGVNEILPLKAICLLERDTENSIEKIPFSNAFPALANQFHHPENNRMLAESVKLVGQLHKINTYRLQCNMDDEAAIIAYKGMSDRNE